MLFFVSGRVRRRNARDGINGNDPCILIFQNTVPLTAPILLNAQELGSLYDLIHNNTVPIDRDISLQLLRDICQGSLPVTITWKCQPTSLQMQTCRNAISSCVVASDMPRGPQELEHIVGSLCRMPVHFWICDAEGRLRPRAADFQGGSWASSQSVGLRTDTEKVPGAFKLSVKGPHVAFHFQVTTSQILSYSLLQDKKGPTCGYCPLDGT